MRGNVWLYLLDAVSFCKINPLIKILKMRFNKLLFQDTINIKCFEYQMKEKKVLGLRYFADKIGISASTLSRIKNGAEPDLTTFCKVCEFFDIESNYFLHR